MKTAPFHRLPLFRHIPLTLPPFGWVQKKKVSVASSDIIIMQSDQQQLDSSCNGSEEAAENNIVKKTTRSFASRRLKRLATFGNSFSSHDLTSLYDVEELVVEEESDEDDIEEEFSSPRGVFEDFSISTESETLCKESTSNSLEYEASSPMTITSEAEEGPNHNRSLSGPWRDFFRVFRKGPQAGIQNIPAVKKRVPKLTKWKSKKIREALLPSMASSSLDTADLYCLKPSWKNFSLSELQAATNDFSNENLIGQGGYAEVYKGQLDDGQFVAIKKLTRGSPDEMTVDYLSEVGIIAHVDHPNIARLVGYGVDGGMHLVLELSPNGSLSTILYEEKDRLDWGLRFKVALGTAQGLLYLHEECQRRIIHKDIKASNILLTEDFEPQISDFGLAKWLPDEWTHHTVSKIEGTFGYLPPEFFLNGIVDEKTDVYSYGVLLLELITGKQALDNSQHSLVMWAKPLLQKSSLKELADPALSEVYDSEQMDRVICVASMCVHQIPSERPQMSQVVKMLNGDEDSLQEAKQNQKRKLKRTFSEELVDAEDYNATKYLNDLNRHMEIALGQCSETASEEETPEAHLNGLNEQYLTVEVPHVSESRILG